MDNETIGVIGAGPVGRSMATGLVRVGHQVRIGVREPSDAKHRELRSTTEVVDLPTAVGDAAFVVLAVPAESLADVVPRLDLRPGQVVVDATNAVFSVVPDGFDSLGGFVASFLEPGVHFVKAFNTIGAEHLSGTDAEPSTFLPIAGDDAGVDRVAELARQVGFQVAVLGDRSMVGMVEAHARLWIHLAIRQGWGRDMAFSVVHR